MLTYVCIFILASMRSFDASQTESSVKQPTFEFKGEQPYIFPEISDGDAVQPALQLLLSQQKYHNEVTRLYEELWEKNVKHGYLRYMSYELGDSVRLVGDLINDAIKIVQAQIENGTLEEDFKKEPLDDSDSGALLDNWRFIAEYVGNDIEERGLDADEQVEAMRKPIKYAIREMEAYDKYLNRIYEESGRDRIFRP